MRTPCILFVVGILCLISTDEAAVRPYGFDKSHPYNSLPAPSVALPPPLAWPTLSYPFKQPSPPTPSGTRHGLNFPPLPEFRKPPPSPPLGHHQSKPQKPPSPSLPRPFPYNFPPASPSQTPVYHNKWPALPFPFPYMKPPPAPNSYEHTSQPPLFAPPYKHPHPVQSAPLRHTYHQSPAPPAPVLLLSPQRSEAFPPLPFSFESPVSPPLPTQSLSPLSHLSPLSSYEALSPTV